MDIRLLIILVIFCVINAIAFIIMWVDKVKSSYPGAERISEGMMFFLATIFGSLGVYAGMFVFRHKTRKWYFLIGIPLLVIQNSSLLFLVYLFLSQQIIK